MNTVNNTNENRQRAHLELALLVSEFEMANNVTYCKPQRNPKSRQVRGKTKLVFGSKPPVNRPCVMFDNVPLVV